jgi:hypothetical protein
VALRKKEFQKVAASFDEAEYKKFFAAFETETEKKRLALLHSNGPTQIAIAHPKRKKPKEPRSMNTTAIYLKLDAEPDFIPSPKPVPQKQDMDEPPKDLKPTLFTHEYFVKHSSAEPKKNRKLFAKADKLLLKLENNLGFLKNERTIEKKKTLLTTCKSLTRDITSEISKLMKNSDLSDNQFEALTDLSLNLSKNFNDNFNEALQNQVFEVASAEQTRGSCCLIC